MTELSEKLFNESFTLTGNDFEHGGEVSSQVKLILKELGLETTVVRRLSIANFEAEMNVIMYAQSATFDLSVTPGRVQVTLADQGPGIPDVDQAMQEGWSTATPEMRARGFGAGLGLPNIKRNTDEFTIETNVGVGTTLRYSIFLT